MSQNPKRETRIITVYDDGTIHIQELHEATSTAVALDDDPSGDLGGDDSGGNNPPPPRDP